MADARVSGRRVRTRRTFRTPDEPSECRPRALGMAGRVPAAVCRRHVEPRVDGVGAGHTREPVGGVPYPRGHWLAAGRAPAPSAGVGRPRGGSPNNSPHSGARGYRRPMACRAESSTDTTTREGEGSPAVAPKWPIIGVSFLEHAESPRDNSPDAADDGVDYADVVAAVRRVGQQVGGALGLVAPGGVYAFAGIMTAFAWSACAIAGLFDGRPGVGDAFAFPQRDFYSAVAQVLPVLLLTLAVEKGYFGPKVPGANTLAGVLAFGLILLGSGIAEILCLTAVGTSHPSHELRAAATQWAAAGVVGALSLIVGQAVVASGLFGHIATIALDPLPAVAREKRLGLAILIILVATVSTQYVTNLAYRDEVTWRNTWIACASLGIFLWVLLPPVVAGGLRSRVLRRRASQSRRRRALASAVTVLVAGVAIGWIADPAAGARQADRFDQLAVWRAAGSPDDGTIAHSADRIQPVCAGAARGVVGADTTGVTRGADLAAGEELKAPVLRRWLSGAVTVSPYSVRP